MQTLPANPRAIRPVPPSRSAALETALRPAVRFRAPRQRAPGVGAIGSRAPRERRPHVRRRRGKRCSRTSVPPRRHPATRRSSRKSSNVSGPGVVSAALGSSPAAADDRGVDRAIRARATGTRRGLAPARSEATSRYRPRAAPRANAARDPSSSVAREQLQIVEPPERRAPASDARRRGRRRARARRAARDRGPRDRARESARDAAAIADGSKASPNTSGAAARQCTSTSWTSPGPSVFAGKGTVRESGCRSSAAPVR